MNFARDVVDASDPKRMALVEVARDGRRREWSFGEVADHSARLAGTLVRHGIGRGDVVLTLIGTRPEWVLTMVACFRIGAVPLPCNEQLRSNDLRARLAAASPKLIVSDERNLSELGAADPQSRVLIVPDETLLRGEPPPPVELSAEEPCMVIFTSGTSGESTGIVHGQRYLMGQRLQGRYWLDARDGDLVWCTAASGWSKSARNAFIAPWLRGATAFLHDARFEPTQRLELARAECVNVLCMSPTEYRVIAKRTTLSPLPALRSMVAAGEALDAEVLRAFSDGTGLMIRDGYGQTETGQLTGMPVMGQVRPGSMGRALPGVKLRVEGGELLLADPHTDPTFFVSYLDGTSAPTNKPWRTGDRVNEDQDGFLYFEGRADDVIISAGYRIAPFEVESALLSHPLVADAAVVAEPDDERGAVVRAVVVLRDGYQGSREVASALQAHVKRETAPYKYPRIVDFVAELPRTASGKVRRAALRQRP